MSSARLEKHTEKPRIYLFDNVKCLAIILVVIGHAIDFLTHAGANQNQFEKSLYVLIYSFHMPLFLFVSGLFLKPMDKDTKFPKDKVIAFIAIGIVLRAFTSILKLFLGENPQFAVLDIYDSYAWFMGAMAVFIVLTWLLRSYSIKIVLPIALLVGCMSALPKRTFLTGNPTRRCAVSLSAALAP
ncbi:acyltransferase family protein [Ruminococcus bovis]|uniref:DUF1624 domain-containing protein n=1 Tax=Ruminococcus bovis TaxID=2564099 RepID=A0A4P8XVV3_9FIRM|nr:acyltransferase family protein [Ruminococcus bovis]QCT06822.1 DUF1624 domain-containing protein [Ruminococcus bovis]